MSTPVSTPRHQKRGFYRPWMLPVGVLALGLVELSILVWIALNTNIWWAVLAVVVGWIIGFSLLFAAGQQSVSRLVSVYRTLRGRGDLKAHMSRPLFTLLAAVCFFFPGLLTDVAGVVLLLTPVQKRALRRTGISGGTRTRLAFPRRGGGIIEGEIVVDNTRSSGHAQEKTPPTVIEGDVSSR